MFVFFFNSQIAALSLYWSWDVPKGEKKDFGIVKYFIIHSNAHNDLETAGEIMTDSMKITNFLGGLQDPIAITYAISTKAEPGVVSFHDDQNLLVLVLL